MKADLYTKTGSKSGQIDVPSLVFGTKLNEVLLAQYRRVFLSNQRRAKAKTKTRGEVNGSGKKIWRQKGTGRARHGDRYANIFVGGGVGHGPTGYENYQLKITRKMRRVVLAIALSQKYSAKKVFFIKGLAGIEPKTKSAAQLLGKLNLNKQKLVVVADGQGLNPRRAMRNLDQVEVVTADRLNAYRVMTAGRLLIMSEVLPVLEKLCSSKIKESKKNKKTEEVQE